MKDKIQFLFAFIILQSAFTLSTNAQGTAFTYQGRLNDGGSPANGSYDVAFTLYTTITAGSVFAGPMTNSAVVVTNGLFTTTVDFGPSAFTGGSNWLEIAVSTNGANSYTTLAPRQQLTPMPYAIYSANAGSATTAANITGTISLAQLPNAVMTNNQTSVTLGNVTVNGSLNLPATTVTAGIINFGGGTFIHAFGANNFFAGTGAGNLTLTGSGNVGVGYDALQYETSGNDNTANGFAALQNNTVGYNNTANGKNALQQNSTGYANTASGWEALWLNTTGFGNTADGNQAMAANTTGNNNAANGWQALRLNTTGSNNTANGSSALYNNIAGSNNVANGYQALASNTSGSENTANGAHALGNNTTAFDNTANGFAALFHNTTGNDNSANGDAALNSNTTGGYNTANGASALLNNINGSYNVANGYQTLANNTSGGGNSANGAFALWANTTGGDNTANGDGALDANTNGNNNTANGFDALFNNSSGNNNIAEGYKAGYNLTTGSNNIDIGNQGLAGESGVIRIGNPGDQTSTFIAGIINGNGGGLTNLNPSQFASAAGITIQQNPGSGAPNVIEGSANNFVTGGVIGATIGGGGATNSLGTNSVNGDFGTVGGGWHNSASINGTVGGGSSNTASGYGAAVGGGVENASSSSSATVSGGVRNAAKGPFSTIGGGYENTASGDSSTVAGGQGNIASGVGSTIGGGNDTYGVNTASGEVSTIGGGSDNTASGAWTTIAGGVQNTVSDYGATVGGGFENSALDQFATVPGGINNTAGGQFSFAAGQQANAVNDGAFVWADSQNAAFSSTANDQFLIRAAGGVGINTNNPHGATLYVKGSRTNGWQNSVAFFENASTATNAAPALRVVCDGGNPLDGALSVSANIGTTTRGLIAEFGNANSFVVTVTNNGTIYTAGSVYAAGNVYANGVLLTSDRNAKENFKPVDNQTVLAKVAALPVTEWNYKSDQADVQHIGPMAQDFQAAFGLAGGDDKHISVVDEGGVALAAIQGLNQKLEETRAENAELKQRLEALEKYIRQQK